MILKIQGIGLYMTGVKKRLHGIYVAPKHVKQLKECMIYRQKSGLSPINILGVKCLGSTGCICISVTATILCKYYFYVLNVSIIFESTAMVNVAWLKTKFSFWKLILRTFQNPITQTNKHAECNGPIHVLFANVSKTIAWSWVRVQDTSSAMLFEVLRSLPTSFSENSRTSPPNRMKALSFQPTLNNLLKIHGVVKLARN
jgi:hypothetical protein